MKSIIFQAMAKMNSQASTEQIGHQSVGFMAGVAMAQLNPAKATALHLTLIRSWSLDPQNPAEYGPSEMAKDILRNLPALGENGQ